MAAAEPYVVEGFTYLAIDILVVAFRIYCRSKHGRFASLGAEDHLMVLAILLLTAETVLAYYVGALYNGIDNSNMTEEQRASLSPNSDEFKMRVGGSKMQVAGWFLYITVLWTIKASMCIFYLHLTMGLHGYKLRIDIGFGVIIITYLALMFSFLTCCQPFNHYWQINPDPGNFCEAAANRLNIYLSLVLNVISDLYLFLIPIPMLWAAQLSRIKRIGLIFLFSGGIVVMICGILRCTAVLQDSTHGPGVGTSWAIRESFVAVTMSNLPMIWRCVVKKLRPFFGSLLSSERSADTKTNRPTGPEPGSIMLDDAAPRNWRSAVHPGQKGVGNHVYIQGGIDCSEENILRHSDCMSSDITKATHYSVSLSPAPAKVYGPFRGLC